MEPVATSVPPVVAVMVVHEPGKWFDETLAALAAQEYPGLRHLFLVAGEPGVVPARIREVIPDAFVRGVVGNPGYGAAANEVLRLVEGANGFFLFLHDDVALDPGSIRALVEESFRSNAGIVGPKLVSWRRPAVLQHVGFAVDRLGEVDSLVEPGEIDQEQHDAVRDVFAVPSACILIRADLFRAIGGFDEAIAYRGDDIDLCWRAHLNGARVVVVPAARARHREALPSRVDEARLGAWAERDRLRTVLTLTGRARLALVIPQLVVVGLLEAVVAVSTGRIRRAGRAVGALLAAIPRAGTIIARRRKIASLRTVPDAEVARLQIAGSARVSSFIRGRSSRATDPETAAERRWRETAGTAPFIAWISLLVLVLVGSRRLITDGVPLFGEFLRFPGSARELWSTFRTGWSGHGLGATEPNPTGLVIVAVLQMVSLLNTGLAQTIAVVGLLVVGHAGAYALGSVFPTVRARLVMLVVYAALPLAPHLLSSGSWGGLVAYAVTPWFVHQLARLSGIETAAADGRDVDIAIRVSRRRRTRLVAQTSLLLAVAIAVVPAYFVVAVVIGLVLAGATLVIGSPWRAAVSFAAGSVGSTAVALVVNLPWSSTLIGGWTMIVGVPVAGAPSLGLRRLAQFELGVGSLGTVALALFLPVVVAPVVSRSWRFAWAVRAVALVAVFGALIVLDDRGALPLRMPSPSLLLVPVGVGVALAAASLAAAFETDVLRGSFGWRQPVGVLSAVAVVVGIVPGVVAVGDGAWNMPRRTLTTVLGEFATDPPEGDYRTLWIGDPRAIPVTPWEYEPGIGYAITDDGPLTVAERWATRPGEIERRVADALRLMASGSTLRGGRLLAPFAIRYVVVPVADGANGTIDRPLTPPGGLLDVLDDQLDLASPLTTPPNYLVFENTAVAPTRSVLTAVGAAASELAGDEAATTADLAGAVPFAVGASDRGPAEGELAAGTLHVAVPFDERWQLTVGGVEIPARRAFGATMAFDVASAGPAVLRYDSGLLRSLAVVAQLLAWIILIVMASRLRAGQWLRTALRRDDEVAESDEAEVDEGPVLTFAEESG